MAGEDDNCPVCMGAKERLRSFNENTKSQILKLKSCKNDYNKNTSDKIPLKNWLLVVWNCEVMLSRCILFITTFI